MIDGELQDLGRTVQETLEDYLERSEQASDYVWNEATFDQSQGEQ